MAAMYRQEVSRWGALNHAQVSRTIAYDNLQDIVDHKVSEIKGGGVGINNIWKWISEWAELQSENLIPI